MNVRLRRSARWSSLLCVAVLMSQANAFVSAQAGPPAAAPAVPAKPGPLFDLAVEREDVATLLRRLASEAGVSLAFAGEVKGLATLSLHGASFDQAVSLITASTGLTFQKLDGTYLITNNKTAGPRVSSEAYYRAQHVRADRLADTLRAVFQPDQLRVVIGPDEFNSPKTSQSTASSSSTTSASSGSGGGLSLDLSGLGGAPAPPPPAAGATQAGPGTRQLILIGEAAVVAHALEICKTMDHRRRQVRISVKIIDIDLEALREFGIKWSWNEQVRAQEQIPEATPDKTVVPVFSFGTLLRDPLFIDVAVSALEQKGRSKLLATPSVSLLDGEHASILIGDRHLYPTLTGYSQAQTPIYSKEEVSVGIRLDVTVAMTDSNDMILTLNPQVSAIIGFLQVGGTSYPQISTREQQTTIRARSGETIMIGGLIKEGENNDLRGMPGLWRIPIIGELFKYRKKVQVRTDLVVMITPEILDDDGSPASRGDSSAAKTQAETALAAKAPSLTLPKRLPKTAAQPTA